MSPTYHFFALANYKLFELTSLFVFVFYSGLLKLKNLEDSKAPQKMRGKSDECQCFSLLDPYITEPNI